MIFHKYVAECILLVLKKSQTAQATYQNFCCFQSRLYPPPPYTHKQTHKSVELKVTQCFFYNIHKNLLAITDYYNSRHSSSYSIQLYVNTCR